ncbi:MAG: alpha/beta hydrolase [Oscillospiraceae bacterium]|jgi:acetyl esterase/lipase|nr:alpha/beta hydrolase [Oscillospiraceae bacterium]
MKVFVEKMPDSNATLTAYLHDSSPELSNANNRPCVIVFPGGGYHMLSDREGEPIAATFLAHGYHAFVLRYSVGKSMCFSDALNDAQKALHCVRSNAEQWNLNPKQIAVCGFSAGGHLAASLGVMGTERPNAMILAYPCILSSMSRILAFPVPSCDDKVDSSTPPAFLFHTANDSAVPVENSLRMADALSRGKIPFELHIFPNGPHGLALANELTSNGSKAMCNQSAAQWMPLCLTWLKNLFNAC